MATLREIGFNLADLLTLVTAYHMARRALAVSCIPGCRRPCRNGGSIFRAHLKIALRLRFCRLIFIRCSLFSLRFFGGMFGSRRLFLGRCFGPVGLQPVAAQFFPQ